MASSLQTLIKILRLEQQKGYQNKAVIGGFARFAFHWAREAHSQAITEEHHQLVDAIAERLRRYDSMPQEERPAQIEEIIALATGDFTVAEPAPPPEEPPLEAPAPAEAPPAEEIVDDELSDLEPEGALDYFDDVGIGEVEGDEDEDDVFDFEVFGTFESEDVVEARSVRERRGYAWQQEVPVSVETLRALNEPVQTVKGVGSARAEQLARLGVHTIRDLLFLFPRRHDDYSRMLPIRKVRAGEDVTVIGVLDRISSHPMKKGGTRVEAYIDDGSAALRLNWFNQPWIERQLEPGEPYVVSGRVDQYLGRLVINSPEMEPIDQESLHAGRIVPVYPLTKGLTNRVMRRLMKDVIDEWAPRLPDHLPLDVRERADLMDFGDAIAQAHFPDSQEDLKAAQRRLAFDELFLLHTAMLQRRRQWQSRAAVPIHVDDAWLQAFEAKLPYSFTGAQRRAIEDIRRDIASELPMNRLLQGDVGSGKTVVAAAAAGMAVQNGLQVAFMAPTSILAEQHYASLCRLLEGEANVALLTGNISAADREAVYAGLADGSINVVVGTHALIQPGLAFHRLGLAVIDEQHRFGVSQRGALRSKADGGNPHLLVMTATPIPRTLALTLHADLDLTVIDEMPPGRTPVQTRVLQPKERERGYAFIRAQVQKGRQAYVICPLVQDSDKLDARSAVAEYERLQNMIFPDLRVGLLHGQMSADEKEAAMSAFYRGEVDILVSTTVIEVGIDVPNATVIMIENANRFGLAQLHQLRGRVGRGSEQSYCLLVSDRPFLDADPRLKAVEETTDGFKLAEIDWQMRGAGNLIGTQQSGFGTLDFANLMDSSLVDEVQREAWTVYERDPDLSAPEHELLRARVEEIKVEEFGDVS
ncbi:MAG: ATP-dependent DNA helicase RecG [Aggregatilineales bacterium]